MVVSNSCLEGGGGAKGVGGLVHGSSITPDSNYQQI